MNSSIQRNCRSVGTTLLLFGCCLAVPFIPLDLRGQAETSSLTGRVSNAVTGAALEGARVELREVGRRAVTDRDGRYHFDDLPLGAVLLRVVYPGLDPVEQTLQLEGGETILNVTLTSEIYASAEFQALLALERQPPPIVRESPDLSAVEDVRWIDLPAAQGLSHISSIYGRAEPGLIGSESELAAYLESLRSRLPRGGLFGDQYFGAFGRVEAALLEADVDFSREALLLLPLTLSSISDKPDWQEPVLVNGTLELKVVRVPPGRGFGSAPALGYRCYALAVTRGKIGRVLYSVDTADPIVFLVRP